MCSTWMSNRFSAIPILPKGIEPGVYSSQVEQRLTCPKDPDMRKVNPHWAEKDVGVPLSLQQTNKPTSKSHFLSLVHGPKKSEPLYLQLTWPQLSPESKALRRQQGSDHLLVSLASHGQGPTLPSCGAAWRGRVACAARGAWVSAWVSAWRVGFQGASNL